MKKPEYTEEEKIFIKKWAVVVDYENDNQRSVFSPSTGKRVSTLDTAQARKRAIDRAEVYQKLRD